MICVRFFPMNPWLGRFDQQLYRLQDAGLRDEFVKRSK